MTSNPGSRLSIRGVTKRFGSTIALGGVDLDVAPAEVHALIGENGAGKSTLMKILSGAHLPDGGRIEVDAKPFAPRDPIEARERGIAMIYQELTVAPHLTVEQNIMLGRERSRFGIVQRAAMRGDVRRALALLDHPEIALNRRVGGMSPAAQQLVEVGRALTTGARIIVMDEPTSSLTRRDTDQLFEVIAKLRSQGVSVIYISHFLDEVKRIADRFTVLRDGRTVGTGEVATTTIPSIVEMMAGRKLDQLYPQIPRVPGAVLLRTSRLQGPRLPHAADLELRRGEILGITGLVGAGRTEFLRALFGLDAMKGGSVTLGSATDDGATPRARLAQGVGMLSEDRKGEGLALGLPIEVNVTLSKLGTLSRFGWIKTRERRAKASTLMSRLQVRARSPRQAVRELSGGNQQKVAIARLLHHDVDVFLLDEPTRGIDVGAKAEIYRLVGELAAAGKSIVFVSSYIPELLGVCDRIAVMSRGRLGPARPVSDCNETSILTEATAVTSENPE